MTKDERPGYHTHKCKFAADTLYHTVVASLSVYLLVLEVRSAVLELFYFFKIIGGAEKLGSVGADVTVFYLSFYETFV